MKEYEIHPIAECYPPLPPKEYEEFKEDIRKNGLLHPVVLFEGKILCGIHRARACKETGIELRTETPKISDPIAYAVGDNDLRRHLTRNERTIAAEALATFQLGDNQYRKIKGSPIGEPYTRKGIAKLLGVSKTMMDKVRLVKKNGGEQFVEAIKNGKLSVDKAYKVTRLPKSEQPKAFELELNKTPGSKKAAPSAVQIPAYPEHAILPVILSTDDRAARQWVRRVLESVEALKRESLLVHQISTVNQYNDARGHTQAILSFDRMYYPNRLDRALVDWASACALAYQKRSLEIQLAKRDRKAAREIKKQLLQAHDTYWQQEEQLLDNLSVHDLSQLGKFWRIKFAEYYARRKASLAGKNGASKD